MFRFILVSCLLTSCGDDTVLPSSFPPETQYEEICEHISKIDVEERTDSVWDSSNYYKCGDRIIRRNKGDLYE